MGGTYKNNHATDNAGAIAFNKKVGANSAPDKLHLNGATFIKNTAVTHPAIRIGGTADMLANVKKIELSGSWNIEGHSAPGACGAFFAGKKHDLDSFKISHGSIKDNSAKNGGAFCFNKIDGDVKIDYVTISGNHAEKNGGAIYVGEAITGNLLITGNPVAQLSEWIKGFKRYLRGLDGDKGNFSKPIHFSGNSAGESGGVLYAKHVGKPLPPPPAPAPPGTPKPPPPPPGTPPPPLLSFTVTLKDCFWGNNSAKDGGVINIGKIEGNGVEIRALLSYNNSAIDKGGTIFINDLNGKDLGIWQIKSHSNYLDYLKSLEWDSLAGPALTKLGQEFFQTGPTLDELEAELAKVEVAISAGGASADLTTKRKNLQQELDWRNANNQEYAAFEKAAFELAKVDHSGKQIINVQSNAIIGAVGIYGDKEFYTLDKCDRGYNDISERAKSKFSTKCNKEYDEKEITKRSHTAPNF